MTLNLAVGHHGFVCAGELGKLDMLHEGILHKCIKQLLEKKKMAIKDMSEDMECLCQIMRTVGKRLDHEKAKLWMDAYFERMKAFQANQELPSRVRFMLQDVIELRRNRWQPRRNMNEGAPKTIQQVGEFGLCVGNSNRCVDRVRVNSAVIHGICPAPFTSTLNLLSSPGLGAPLSSCYLEVALYKFHRWDLLTGWWKEW